MIRINKDSWHYRYINKVDINIKPNRCSYTRAFCIATLLYVLMAFMLTAMTVVFVAGPILGIIALWWDDAPYLMYNTFVPLAVPIAAVYVVVGLIYLWVKTKNRRINAAMIKYNVNHEDDLPSGATMPDLIGAWYRDFHDKTCSTIEFYRD